jgi:hypothetical protein
MLLVAASPWLAGLVCCRPERLTLPILTIAGEENSGELVANTMKPAADEVESLIIPDCGHYPAEEAPEAMLAALRSRRRRCAAPRPALPAELRPWGGPARRVRAVPRPRAPPT